MNEQQLREMLEDVVWGESTDVYEDARRILNSRWIVYPWVNSAVHTHIKHQAREYRTNSVKIYDRCNICDPGVRIMYDHYKNISDRYSSVERAMA